MFYRGIRNWPPTWTSGRSTRERLPTGEIGILKDVSMHTDPFCEIILTMENGGRSYKGSLRFEDPWFCSHVYSVLQQYLGHTIQEIGALELPD